MNIKNILLVYAFDCETVDHVKLFLKKHKIDCKATKRDFLEKHLFENKDLIIVIGGDGTFLRTSHYIRDNTPILGLNCDIRINEGFFMRANRQNFEEKFQRLLKDNFRILKLTRLEGVLDNKNIPELPLNEFFIGNQKPYHVSNYRIHVEDKEETQKSSGVIVATASGAHAWAKSAAGFYLPLESNKYQYIVREPYQGRLSGKYELVRGLLNANQQVTITSEMKNGIVVVDSNTAEYPFKTRSVLNIRTTKRYLNVVNFLNK